MEGSFVAIRRLAVRARGLGFLGVAWALYLWVEGPVFAFLAALTMRAFADAGILASAVRDVLNDTQFIFRLTTAVLLFCASLAVPIGMLVRMLARAAVRATMTDPLAGVRRRLSVHPRVERALAAVPSVTWLAAWTAHVALFVGRWGGWSMYGEYAGTPRVHQMHVVYAAGMGIAWAVAAAASVGIYAVTRAGLRGLLAPVEHAQEGAPPSEDRIRFDAVAVTPETRAAVALMAAFPVIAVAGIQVARLGDAATQAALLAYAAAAVGAALAFRRASRIAVGADGVFVSGTSRTRFFAYRDLDGVASSGHDIALVRGSRVILRLQLHGEDVAQRASLAARIDQGIVGAREGTTRGAAQVVLASSSPELSRMAQGASDYRAPALTREQLWSIVEGAEHDGATRTQAARALVETGDDGDRARVRVAASRCAEPRVRVLLEGLAVEGGGEDGEEEAVPTAPRKRAS